MVKVKVSRPAPAQIVSGGNGDESDGNDIQAVHASRTPPLKHRSPLLTRRRHWLTTAFYPTLFINDIQMRFTLRSESIL